MKFLCGGTSWTLDPHNFLIKTLQPLFMDEVEPLEGGSLLFNTKFSEVPPYENL